LITALVMYAVKPLAISSVAGAASRARPAHNRVDRSGADHPADRTACAVRCWHSSEGRAADALRIRLDGVVDVSHCRRSISTEI
jgi:hypothetical protein